MNIESLLDFTYHCRALGITCRVCLDLDTLQLYVLLSWNPEPRLLRNNTPESNPNEEQSSAEWNFLCPSSMKSHLTNNSEKFEIFFIFFWWKVFFVCPDPDLKKPNRDQLCNFTFFILKPGAKWIFRNNTSESNPNEEQSSTEKNFLYPPPMKSQL